MTHTLGPASCGSKQTMLPTCDDCRPHMVALTRLAHSIPLTHPCGLLTPSAGAHTPALQWASQLLTDRDYLGDTPDHQRVGWGQDLGMSINQTLTAMQLLKVPITVDVKLVGFAGDG